MSNGSSTGSSPTNRLAQLQTAAATIEQLANSYHTALQPVQAALQAVADTPFDRRESWAAAVSALARRLVENGLGDVPASRQGAERWDRQFDAGKPGNAFVGHAFFTALADAITTDAPPTALFSVLDKYPFVPQFAVQEVCRALSQLLYVHKTRVAPRFTAEYGQALAVAGMDGETLAVRLAQCEIRLSDDARVAIYDWDQCAMGFAPCYAADIRPSRPAWVKHIDERVSKLYVARPRDLDPELAEAFYAIAVGMRECARLHDSLPYRL